MENPVLIFGAGTLGKLALDIFESNQVLVYGFLDDNKELHNREIGEVMVLGETDDDGFLKLIGQKTEAFVALGNTSEREHVVDMLLKRRKVQPVNAIHPRAFVSESASIGHGNLIAAGAVINPEATIHNYAIVHSGAVIDTGATVENYANIGTGAMINTGATIGEGAFIGSGAIVVGGVSVGKNARIGAGSVVIENIKSGETVFGNPAKKM